MVIDYNSLVFVALSLEDYLVYLNKQLNKKLITHKRSVEVLGGEPITSIG